MGSTLHEHTSQLNTETVSPIQTIKYAVDGSALKMFAKPSEANKSVKKLTSSMKLASHRRRLHFAQMKKKKEETEKMLELKKRLTKAEARRKATQRSREEPHSFLNYGPHDTLNCIVWLV